MRISDILMEKLITFGGQAYPKFGHIVILAGGAGSGKGYQTDKLLGIQGKVMDVDRLKSLSLRSAKIQQAAKQITGIDLSDMDLGNPDHVRTVHELLSDEMKVTSRYEQNLFAGIIAQPKDRKPNLIFDVTLKSMSKLESITRNVKALGYQPENIHIVWVVNDVTVALQQSRDRERVVPDEILINTHQGVAITMKLLLSMGDALQKYMNGDIWITFNRAGIDTNTQQSDYGGSYIDQANYFRVKQQGRGQIPPEKLSQNLYNKIREYAPKSVTW